MFWCLDPLKKGLPRSSKILLYIWMVEVRFARESFSDYLASYSMARLIAACDQERTIATTAPIQILLSLQTSHKILQGTLVFVFCLNLSRLVESCATLLRGPTPPSVSYCGGAFCNSWTSTRTDRDRLDGVGSMSSGLTRNIDNSSNEPTCKNRTRRIRIPTRYSPRLLLCPSFARLPVHFKASYGPLAWALNLGLSLYQLDTIQNRGL